MKTETPMEPTGDAILTGLESADLTDLAGRLIVIAAAFSCESLRRYLLENPSHLRLAFETAPTMCVKIAGVANGTAAKRVSLTATHDGNETEIAHIEFNPPTSAGKTIN